MRKLVLTVSILNFVVYFPYNGSQQIYTQRHHHWHANPLLSSSDDNTADQILSTLQGNENSTPTQKAKGYLWSTEKVAGPSGFLKDSQTLQTYLSNLPSPGNEAPDKHAGSQTPPSFDYVNIAVDSATQAEVPKNNASPFFGTMQDTSNAYRTSSTNTANDAKSKMDIEGTTANFQHGVTPRISRMYPKTVGYVYFGENNVADMASDSKISTVLSKRPSDIIKEDINLSTADRSTFAYSNPGTDFVINKGYPLQSVGESSTLLLNAQNNESQPSLIIKDNSLADASKKVSTAADKFYPINGAIVRQETDEISADPLNTPLTATFLTADFTSSSDTHNAPANMGKRNVIMTDGSELTVKEVTMPERKSTIAITSLPERAVVTLPPRARHEIFIDKKGANEEEPITYTEMEPTVKETVTFQTKENLSPANKFKFFELGNSLLERVADTKNFLSKSSSNIPLAEETIGYGQLTNAGQESINVPFDTTSPTNYNKHFQPAATQTRIDGFGKSATATLKVGESDYIVPSSYSNFKHHAGGMHNFLHPKVYHNVITDKPLTIIKENTNVSQNNIEPKLLVSTKDNTELTDYRSSYQTPSFIQSSTAKTMTSKGKTDDMETINIPLGTSAAVGSLSYASENTEVIKDMASIAATPPIKKGILSMDEVITFNSEPHRPGYVLNIPEEDPNVSRDNGNLLVSGSPTFVKSVVPFNHPQATGSVKRTSLADIIIPKAFSNEATSAAWTVPVTSASEDINVVTPLYTQRNEYENSFKEDITLNYDILNNMAEGKDIPKEENVKENIFITPIMDSTVPKGNNMASTDALDFPRFRETIKTFADQYELGNSAPSQMAEVSKSLFEKHTPLFEGKEIIRNLNSGAKHFEDPKIHRYYASMDKNIPKRYIFVPERKSRFTAHLGMPVKGNINPSQEGNVELGNGISRQNDISYSEKQNDPEVEKHQIATDIMERSHPGNILIPVTSATVSFEDINVGKYPHVSERGIPLSLKYANTLRDGSFMPRPEVKLEKENNLYGMNLITIEPEKNNSKYFINKYGSGVEEKENYPTEKSTQFTHGVNRFMFKAPTFNDEASKSLLYRRIYPELETEGMYKTTIVKEENPDSATVTSALPDYTKNLHSQHLRTMAPPIIGAGEVFPPGFPGGLSTGKDTANVYDTIVFPDMSDLGKEKINYSFSPDTEMITNMEESRIFRAEKHGDAVITTPLESQGRFNRKHIPFNVYDGPGPQLAGTITSAIPKVSRKNTNLTEVTPSEDNINPLAQEIDQQADNISHAGEVHKDTLSIASISSFYPYNNTQMPLNATTISSTVHFFVSKESNENNGSFIPEKDGALLIKLKSLLIPNEERAKASVALSKNDDPFSDNILVAPLKISQPLDELSTHTGKKWEVTKKQNDPQNFFTAASVSLEDFTPLSENPINVPITGIPAGKENINDKIETIAFLSNIVPQPEIHKRDNINQTSDYNVSQHVNQPVLTSSMKGVTSPRTPLNSPLSKHTNVEDVTYISETNSPASLREINTIQLQPFILSSESTSVGQKPSEILEEIFHPDSLMNTENLTKARARDSFTLNRDTPNYYNKLYHMPPKSTLLHTYIIKSNNSELYPGLGMGEDNIKRTDDSIISNRVKTIMSPENGFINRRSIINEKRYGDNVEDIVTEYGDIPFAKDFTTESDTVFLAKTFGKEGFPNYINTMTIGVDDSTLKYVSGKGAFYGEERKSPTTKTPTLTQGLHNLDSDVSFPTAYTLEHHFKENPVDIKAGKYQVLSSWEGNADSVKDNSLLKDYTTKFHIEEPRIMIHSFTDGSKNVFPGITDDSTLKRRSMSESEVIAMFPDLQHYSQDSIMSPIVSTTLLDSPANSNLTSLSSVNEKPTYIFVTEKGEIHSKPQNDSFPTKISPIRVYEERKLDNLSDQGINATKLELSNFTNRAILIPAAEKITPSETETKISSKIKNSVEEEVRISEASNFFPKDPNALKDNSLVVISDAIPAKTEARHLEKISFIDPALTFLKASRPNIQMPASSEVATRDRAATNVPTVLYDLPWKSNLASSDSTNFLSSSKYGKFNPVIKMEYYTRTNNNNDIPPEKRHILPGKALISPSTIISTNGMKNTIYESGLQDKILTEKDKITEYETISFAENIPQEAYGSIFTGENAQNNENIVTGMLVENTHEYFDNNKDYELEGEGKNLVKKITHINNASVFGSPIPHSSSSVFQGGTDIKSNKIYQILIPQGENPNSDNDSVLKKSTTTVNTKAPKPTIYSPIDPTWFSFPEFTEQVILEDSPSNRGNSIILSNSKRMNDSLVSDPGPKTMMGKSRVFAHSSVAPIEINNNIDNKGQFNGKIVSSAFYSNASPGRMRSQSARLNANANEHKMNFEEMIHSQSKIIPRAKFSVISDNGLPFTSKDVEEVNNIESISSFSTQNPASTLAEDIVISSEDSYGRGYPVLPGKDNANTRGSPHLQTSAILIPKALAKYPETSDLKGNSSSVDLKELKGPEYIATVKGDEVPENQTTTQADIQWFPFTWDAPQTGSSTLASSLSDGDVHSLVSTIRDTPDHYEAKNAEIYPKPQTTIIRPFPSIVPSQNTVFEKWEIIDLSDKEDPASKFELGHFTNAEVSIPSLKKIFPSVTKSNILSKSNNNEEEIHISEASILLSEDTSTLNDNSFTVKSDKPEAPPNCKGMVSPDTILTFSEDTQPKDPSSASHNIVVNKRGSITNIGPPSALWKPISPLYFRTSVDRLKYPQLDPIMPLEKDTIIKTNNILLKEIGTASDKIPPVTFSSEKDSTVTFKEKISGNRYFLESEKFAHYKIINYPEDISTMDKNTPKYMDNVDAIFYNIGSEYVSYKHPFELERKSNNPFVKENMPTYILKAPGSNAFLTRPTASDSLSFATPSESKSKENYHTTNLGQENKGTDVTILKDSTVNVNTKAHAPTPHILIDAHDNFPLSFPDKTSIVKGPTYSDVNTILPYEAPNLENKLTKHFLVVDREPIVESKCDATNHAVKDTHNFFNKHILPTMFKELPPRKADTATSGMSEGAGDETSKAAVSESNVFPGNQLSNNGIFYRMKNKEDSTNTALTHFPFLERLSTIMPSSPAISTEAKSNFPHSSHSFSENAMSSRVTSMGLPEILTLATTIPTNGPATPGIVRGSSLYYPSTFISAVSEPVSTDTFNLNEITVPQAQGNNNHIISNDLPLAYTVLRAGMDGFSDTIPNIEPSTSLRITRQDKILNADTFGGLNAEPKKANTKFSSLFPNEPNNEPNFHHTKGITKTPSVKDTDTDFGVRHCTDEAKTTGNGPVIEMETTSLKDADQKGFSGI